MKYFKKSKRVYICRGIKLSFLETCDIWNASNWTTMHGIPNVVGGTWEFNIPAGVATGIDAFRTVASGYGTYKIRFRASGVRPVGYSVICRMCALTPPVGAEDNELNIQSSNNGIVGELFIEFYRNGVNKHYYINVQSLYGINFEDGNLHELEIDYSDTAVIVKLDGVTILNAPETPSTPILPLPPMIYALGSFSDGTQTSPYSFVVDQISCTQLVTVTYSMSISVDKTQGLVGDTFTFSAQLLADDSPIPNVTIDLYREGLVVVSKLTNTNGICNFAWVEAEGPRIKMDFWVYSVEYAIGSHIISISTVAELPPSPCPFHAAYLPFSNHPDLLTVRAFRDLCVPEKAKLLYYKVSPKLTPLIIGHIKRKQVIRLAFKPFVKVLRWIRSS
jgi:hypothetical protein